ncbi:GNAT family N-acetyltransferase [Phyllobacterium phragmitis]|uniref:GNAT family N-acetyltransferase n=1 Tax=Phyllobacterium phragmitis TaxID=2670329 RepID=A0A2S9ISR3_9HYPH|nr:GNAT family N-acetyltransferase [Phyllobacterium phragmitis]PRD43583.1 GNAT family N-acetyltransferase [Phyllobacterium phragmitis]
MLGNSEKFSSAGFTLQWVVWTDCKPDTRFLIFIVSGQNFQGVNMSEVAENYRIAGSFDSRIGDIRDANLEQLHQLSVSVRWPHRAEDWQLLRTVGRGVVALDTIDRVLGSAMWFPFGETVATIGMVITSPRLQENGTAQWLVQHILERCGEREMRVNAPPNVRRFFNSLGFSQTRSVSQFQGHVSLKPAHKELPSTNDLRELSADDLEAMVGLDALAFGGERAQLLAQLLKEGKGFGIFNSDVLRGFALFRHFGRGGVIGPIVAFTESEAVALVAKHMEKRGRQFLRVDTPVSGGPFAEFLTASGLEPVGNVVTMVRSPAANDSAAFTDHPRTFGLTSHTLG